MFPRDLRLVGPGDLPVGIASQAGSTAGNIGLGSRGRAVVTGERAIAIQETEIGCLDTVLARNQIAHASGGDELLALQYAAKQQTDDYEHDRDLDQRESGL